MQALEADVAVVGGGVVGLSVLRDLCVNYEGLKVVCLESNSDLCGGASGGNSGIVCTGYDAPHGSLERRLLSAANQIALPTISEMGVPFEQTGALVVAWSEEQEAKLPWLLEENHKVGDVNARILAPDELYRREPSLKPSARAALLVPGETVVDSWLFAMAYAEHAIEHGASVVCGAKVVAVQRSELECSEGPRKLWEVRCQDGTVVRAKTVVNAAGNFADLIEKLRTGESPAFRCQPRRGQYAVFAPPPAGPTVTAPIQPVPSHRTKGVYLFRSLYGHVVCGPTAEDVEERAEVNTDADTVERLIQHACNTLPGLKREHYIGAYAGLRPATEHRDYVIRAEESGTWITAAGIRSTGLSASLAIAPHLSSLLSLPVQRRTTPKACTPLPPPEQLARQLPEIRGGADEDDVAVTLRGVARRVSHPLTRWGLRALRASIK